MADRFASQTKPSPEVPRLYGISNSSFFHSKSIVQLNEASRGLVESAETCKKDPDGIFFGLAAAADISRSAVETRRYGLGAVLFRDLF